MKFELITLTKNGKERFFVMRTPWKRLTCRMCNSQIFKNTEYEHFTNSDVSIFAATRTRLIRCKPVDMRTKEAKRLIAKYGFFNAGILTEGF